jgi:flagellar basal-body rod modification protein FlgD
MTAMGIKQGTKAFGVTTGTPSAGEMNNVTKTLSVEDQKKFGDQDVGDVLNKMADPNYVDPSKKMRTVGNDKLDKDAFFKLMIAQMKNQDPTNPLKSHEMAAQLANFSSLEQMQNMNKTLNEMKQGQKPSENYQALNLIGKTVAGDSSKLSRIAGDVNHEFRFDLPMDASEVVVKVHNAEGDVIKSYDMKALKAGGNRASWNGQDEKGTVMPPGEYTFSVEAKAGERKLAAKTDFNGVISGINYTPDGPVLLVGQQTIKMRDVRKITDASLMNNDQKINNVPAQDLKTQGEKVNTGKVHNAESAKQAAEATMTTPQAAGSEAPKGATTAPKVASNIMDNVGLSREMMTKLMKETK